MNQKEVNDSSVYTYIAVSNHQCHQRIMVECLAQQVHSLVYLHTMPIMEMPASDLQ
jgi:hypothetical protein